MYGRKQEKGKAYDAWVIAARTTGETALLERVLAALKWQAPAWEADGWRFAPYFERYLKRRKWEDEPVSARPRAARDAGWENLGREWSDELPDDEDWQVNKPARR